MNSPAFVHFIGVGGSGMLPLAELLLKKGYAVTGSDRLIHDPTNLNHLSPPIRKRIDRLRSLGAQIFPQDGSGINTSTKRVVHSTAIEKDNPDFLKAQELAIELSHRAQELNRQVSQYNLMAIAGTSGKSTTTALCAWFLMELGELGCFVGGSEILGESEWSAVHVAAGQWACVELDESDRSLLSFHPNLAVILNITRDHHTYEENLEIFEQFATHVRSQLWLNPSDEGCKELAKRLPESIPIRWFIPPKPNEIESNPQGIAFSFNNHCYKSRQIGAYHAANMTAALSLIHSAIPNASTEALQHAAKTFPGIRRRMQRYSEGPVAVFDDYAHNPEKLEALLCALQEHYPRVHLVFQPHGYSPLRFHLQGFTSALNRTLRNHDVLYLLPIYDAGGTTNRTIASEDLAQRISQATVHNCLSREELMRELHLHVHPGDAIVVAGARDDTLAHLAEKIAQRIIKII